MALALTVLGSSGTWASATSGCSGYLVDDGTTRLWVDCGPGSLSALQHHCAVADVDALIVSHEHPDHLLDLPVLRNAMVYGLGVEGLPLYAPRAALERIDILVGAGGVRPSFVPTALADGAEVTIGTLRVRTSRTDHPVETLAVRVDPLDGSSAGVAYSADTGPGWSVAALGAGIGLAVVEATYLSADAPNRAHRTAAFTGADARAAGVGHLVVTHVPPTGDPEVHRAEAEAAFGGPVSLAVPHARFEAGPPPA